METFAQQPNISFNLESLESDFSLTKKELDEFKKLPKDEQEKLKKTKLAELKEMSDKLDVAFQEAVKTGKLDEAQKLREQIEKEIDDLKKQTEISELFPEILEIIPDREITSAKIAIEKLEAAGFDIDDTKDALNEVNWEKSLKNSYDIVELSLGELFGCLLVGYNNIEGIKKKAKEKGLVFVPPALAPSIRLQYKKKGGGYAIIATDPMARRGIIGKTFFCLVDMRGDNGLASGMSLCADERLDFGFNSEERFIFARDVNNETDKTDKKSWIKRLFGK